MRSRCRRVRRRRGRRRGHAGTLTRLALLAVALCACGDNKAQALPHGGSRLELVDYVFDDGARVTDPHLFWDEALGEYCTATRFSDGNRYCMPTSAAGVVFYTDDKCTTPIGGRRAQDPDPPHFFISYFSIHGTTLPSRLSRAGAAVVTPRVIFNAMDGACLVMTPDTFGGTFYSVGEVLAPTDLVRLRELSRTSGDRVEVGIDTSDDGLNSFGVSYDRLGGECSITGDDNASEALCLQSPFLVSTLFGDASCTDLLATALSGYGSVPKQVIDQPSESVGCMSLYDVGDPIADPAVYWHTGGTCRPTTVETGVLYFHTTPSPIGIARISRSPRTTTKRVSAYDLIDGPLTIPTSVFYDQTLGTECRLTPVGDDLVCIPAAHRTTTVFADASCSTPLKLGLLEVADCAEPVLFASDDDGTFPIEQPYAQTMYELTTGDRCDEYFAPPGYRAYTLGPALSLDTLPRATIEAQR